VEVPRLCAPSVDGVPPLRDRGAAGPSRRRAGRHAGRRAGAAAAADQTAAAQALSAKVTAIPNTRKKVLVGAGNKHFTLPHFTSSRAMAGVRASQPAAAAGRSG
jgi:hypothetical protein